MPEEDHNSKRYKHPMFTAALFTMARTWKQPRRPLTDESRKDVVHTHNEILLSHKTEQNWVISLFDIYLLSI